MLKKKEIKKKKLPFILKKTQNTDFGHNEILHRLWQHYSHSIWKIP